MRWTGAHALLVGLVALLLGAAPASASRVLVVGDSIARARRGTTRVAARAPGAVDLVADRTTLFDNGSGLQGSTAYADPTFDRDHHALWGRVLRDEQGTIGSVVIATASDVVALGLSPSVPDTVAVDHLFDMHVGLADPQLVPSPAGIRMIFIAEGGMVAGARVRGEVIPGGGDGSSSAPTASAGSTYARRSARTTGR